MVYVLYYYDTYIDYLEIIAVSEDSSLFEFYKKKDIKESGFHKKVYYYYIAYVPFITKEKVIAEEL